MASIITDMKKLRNIGIIAHIDAVKHKINEVKQDNAKLLEWREVATAYRLQTLLEYKRQLDETGFVRTPSREDVIEEIQDSILLGKSILLTGATGTGKTVMAVEAVKEISQIMNVGYRMIKGNELAEELKNKDLKQELHAFIDSYQKTDDGLDVGGFLKKLVDKHFKAKTGEKDKDFVHVISGTPDMKSPDLIVKNKLKAGEKGGTEMYSELGKLILAFTENEIPIIDEIDIIPNDTLMRIKHLFTLKPGKSYAPQENGNEKYILKTVNIVATANIKSAKHPNREDMDPAIIRLLDNIHVNYLPKGENYDLALVNIMDKAGFIYKAALCELDNDDSVLVRLIYCLKRIEENYLGIGDGESVTINASKKDKQYLYKAVLELGKFIGMFSGFSVSSKSFSGHVKSRVLNFICNMAYPRSDRLILIKIFSEKGFVTAGDAKELAKIMDDVSEDVIKENILPGARGFISDSKVFLDQFELASLDPFNIRKLSELEEKLVESPFIIFLMEFDSFLGSQPDLAGKGDLEAMIIDIFEKTSEDINYELSENDKLIFVHYMYSLGLKNHILKLRDIEGFKDATKRLLLIDREYQEPSNRLFSNNDLQDFEEGENEQGDETEAETWIKEGARLSLKEICNELNNLNFQEYSNEIMKAQNIDTLINGETCLISAFSYFITIKLNPF